MYTLEQLESLIDLLYQASVDQDRWPDFLTQLARQLQGVLPTLFLHDTRTQSGALAINAGYDASIVRSYQEYFSQRNLWLNGGAHLLTPGRVRTSHMMCPDAVFRRSEWYADYCRPLGISQGIGATIHNDATLTSNIAIFAGDDRAPFDAADMALLKALMPHLQRALRVHTYIAKTDGQCQELREALEHLSVAVLLVSASARVLFMNRAARDLIGRHDGLWVESHALRAMHPQESARLRALIAAAAQTSARQCLSAGGPLRIGRLDGRSSLQVTVSPLATDEVWSLAERAVAAVYISAPEPVPEVPETELIRRYALTAAQARVAALIIRGLSARRTAETLGLSYNTVKTQLHHIFAKTGTCRQGELIRLIVRESIADHEP